MNESMKQSDIVWADKIPEDWETVKVGLVTECLDYRRQPVDAGLRVSGEYPYWGAGSIMDYVNDYIFDEDLVLLGEDGAPFFDKTRPVSFHINGKVWINNHIHVLKPINIEPDYLVHALNTVDYHQYINGAILPKLTQSDMNKIVIPYPKLSEQKLISQYLNDQCLKLDMLIDAQQQMISRLEELKQSIIANAVTKGLDSTSKLMSTGFYWMGDIPEHWSKGSLIKYLRVPISDGPHETPNCVSDGIPFVSIDSLNGSADIDFSVVKKYISEEDYQRFAKKTVLEPGDILFTKSATIGKTAIVGEEKFMIWSPLAIIKPNYDVMDQKYLYYLLGYDEFVSYAKNLGGFNTQANVGMRDLEKATIPCPPIDEQKKIGLFLDRRINSMDLLIATIQCKISTVYEYKQSLIYEYVTGKKQVLQEA